MATDFDFDFSTALDNLPHMDTETTSGHMHEFTPVKLSSLSDETAQSNAVMSNLKPKHSTTSSVDSGYNSLGYASSSASNSHPVSFTGSQRPSSATRELAQNKGKRPARASPRVASPPVPDSAINFDALQESFQEFSGMNLDLNLDEQFAGDFPFNFADVLNEDMMGNMHLNSSDVFNVNNGNVAAANLSAYLSARYPQRGGGREAG
jgi:hypothetical protein